MPTRLLPTSPLSQVVFVHDYVQLVFQDESFSLYNPIVVKVGIREYEQGTIGFADTLVSLIGEAVTEVGMSEEYAVLLSFEGGVQVQVFKASDASGPEAFQFNGTNGLVVVEQNQ